MEFLPTEILQKSLFLIRFFILLLCRTIHHTALLQTCIYLYLSSLQDLFEGAYKNTHQGVKQILISVKIGARKNKSKTIRCSKNELTHFKCWVLEYAINLPHSFLMANMKKEIRSIALFKVFLRKN